MQSSTVFFFYRVLTGCLFRYVWGGQKPRATSLCTQVQLLCMYVGTCSKGAQKTVTGSFTQRAKLMRRVSYEGGWFFLPLKNWAGLPRAFSKKKISFTQMLAVQRRMSGMVLLLFSAYGVVLALIWSTPSLFDRYMKVQASSTRTCSIVTWIMNDDNTGAAGSHNLKLPCTLLSGVVTSSIRSPIGACSNSTSPLTNSDFCTIILGSTPA